MGSASKSLRPPLLMSTSFRHARGARLQRITTRDKVAVVHEDLRRRPQPESARFWEISEPIRAQVALSGTQGKGQMKAQGPSAFTRGRTSRTDFGAKKYGAHSANDLNERFCYCGVSQSRPSGFRWRQDYPHGAGRVHLAFALNGDTSIGGHYADIKGWTRPRPIRPADFHSHRSTCSVPACSPER
jgi:hypothetical protein